MVPQRIRGYCERGRIGVDIVVREIKDKLSAVHVKGISLWQTVPVSFVNDDTDAVGIVGVTTDPGIDREIVRAEIDPSIRGNLDVGAVAIEAQAVGDVAVRVDARVVEP